jgi:hypothetical protein
MAARYQHVTDTIRQDVAGQVDVLIWQARGAAADDSTIPVSRGSLTAILRLGRVRPGSRRLQHWGIQEGDVQDRV